MMPVTFSPIITDLGQGVFVPLATGIEFTFTHVAVGTGTSAVNSTATALENEIARFPIAGGGINSGGKSASINALITNHTNANPQNYNISEIGFFGLDASSNTILFAIYRQGTTIINKVAGVDIAIPFSLGLGALPASNITVQLDTNISAMMALLGQHSSLNHPHTQYKRTLNNTERLKLADGVDNDEGASIGQLNAEATTRAGVDSALAGQIAQEILDRQAGDTSEATARVNGDLALSIALAAEITNRQNAINSLKGDIPSVLANTVTAGNYVDFTIQPNESIRVYMVGGGGEGGKQSPGGYEVVANDGNNSFLSNQAETIFYVTANGGKRGQGGWYLYQGGAAGEDGKASIDKSYYEYMRLFLAFRGIEPSEVPSDAGEGGVGAAPIANHNGGGKGGWGAFVDAFFTNTSNSPMNLRLRAANEAGVDGGDGHSKGHGGFCLLFREP